MAQSFQLKWQFTPKLMGLFSFVPYHYRQLLTTTPFPSSLLHSQQWQFLPLLSSSSSHFLLSFSSIEGTTVIATPTMDTSSKVLSLPIPSPKVSPIFYPDLYGKRREMARIQMLEREISFLEVIIFILIWIYLYNLHVFILLKIKASTLNSIK